jgi:prepilin-type N-terminal cleavage/methylation domain-containing protein
MNYYDRNNDTGFTLVELLIAMTIGLIILTALRMMQTNYRYRQI